MARLCVLVAALHLLLIKGSLKSISGHNLDDYAHLATGCQNIFVDAGANIGIHARFLFEPHKYPGANYTRRVFDAVFGVERDLNRTCAFEIEPNPAHRHRHQTLERAYQRVGWHYYYVHAAASTSQDALLTFYENPQVANGSRNEGWSFGMKNREHNSGDPPPYQLTLEGGPGSHTL